MGVRDLLLYCVEGRDHAIGSKVSTSLTTKEPPLLSARFRDSEDTSTFTPPPPRSGGRRPAFGFAGPPHYCQESGTVNLLFRRPYHKSLANGSGGVLQEGAHSEHAQQNTVRQALFWFQVHDIYLRVRYTPPV